MRLRNNTNNHLEGGYVSDTRPLRIGVDVMKIEYNGGKPLSEFFRLMTRNFSSDEWKHIKSFNSNTDMLHAFMRHWCLKESYVKNIGTGITVDLSKLNFITHTDQLAPNGRVVIDTKLVASEQLLNNFIFEESLIDNEHCAAVALQSDSSISEPHDPVAFQFVEFEQLIRNASPLTELDDEYCKEVLSKDTKKFNRDR